MARIVVDIVEEETTMVVAEGAIIETTGSRIGEEMAWSSTSGMAAGEEDLEEAIMMAAIEASMVEVVEAAIEIGKRNTLTSLLILMIQTLTRSLPSKRKRIRTPSSTTTEALVEATEVVEAEVVEAEAITSSRVSRRTLRLLASLALKTFNSIMSREEAREETITIIAKTIEAVVEVVVAEVATTVTAKRTSSRRLERIQSSRTVTKTSLT